MPFRTGRDGAPILYSKRFVAFVDVLGFKALVLSPKEKDKEKVERYFTMVQNDFDFSETKGYHTYSIDKVQISDTTLICTDAVYPHDKLAGRLLTNIEQFGLFLYILGSLQARALRFGMLMRGGLTFGEISFKAGTAVGPALIKAYELESADAEHPRIILDNRLISHFGCVSRDEFVNKLWIRELYSAPPVYNPGVRSLNELSDDYLHIDYISPFVLEDGAINFDYLNMIKMTTHDATINYPKRIFQKYVWLRKYCANVVGNLFNDVLQYKFPFDQTYPFQNDLQKVVSELKILQDKLNRA